MNRAELLTLVARGEDSGRQFKVDVTNADSLAADLVAFSNSSGGMLLIGVADDGTLPGLTPADVRRLNQLIGNAATQHMRSPISPATAAARSVESSVESSGKTRDQILDLLATRADLTIVQVAQALGLSTRAIEKQIVKLQQEGLLRRVGPRKSGRWEVLRGGGTK